MQNTAVKAGQDTLILNGYVFKNTGLGDVISLEFPNDIIVQEISYSGTLIMARNVSGNLATLTINVVFGSADDQQLETWASQWTSSDDALTNAPFLQGTYTRLLVDGLGNTIRSVYNLSGGAPTKLAGMRTNSQGDVSSLTATWVITLSASKITS
jgi:hypothetical protein